MIARRTRSSYSHSLPIHPDCRSASVNPLRGKGPALPQEELAALQVGGVDVVRFAGWFYRKIARVPGLEGKILTALDSGGWAALVELLTVYRLDFAREYRQS